MGKFDHFLIIKFNKWLILMFFSSDLITDYECTNNVDSSLFVRDSSKSFPSGHSSISFFSAIFMMWYLQNRIPKIRSYFTILFLQALCLTWACFCATSRISDNRHHWWDVLAGSIIGIIFATLTVSVIMS